MPRTSASKNLAGTAKPVNLASSPVTVFTEDFEGTFPEPNWNYPYDSNSSNGYDYWDDTIRRSHWGSYSAWCAEVGTQFVNVTVWTEDFEGAFPPPNFSVGDGDSSSGDDFWGKTDYRAYEGSWSVWCAQNGMQVFGLEYVENKFVHKYDNDMWAWLQRDVNVGGYSFFTFSFWYWLDSEPDRDWLDVGYYDMHLSAFIIVIIASGNSGGWKYAEVNLPADTFYVDILFTSDSVNKDYEGAYVDNIALIGTAEVPNRSVSQYDDNMMAAMYRPVNLTGYSSATLSYWYWIDSEYGWDYLQAIYTNMTGWFFPANHTGNSNGWQYYEVSISVTATYVGFCFRSDVSLHNHEGAYVDDITLTAIPKPTIESCDAAGTGKDSFDIADTLYAKGSGYEPLATYDVYIVADTDWAYGMTIPARIPWTALSITLDASGNISPITFWFPPLVLGTYDIVIDVNNNSKYDAVDALDDNDIQVTAGFQVIPEFPSLIILLPFMIITLLAAVTYKRKRQTLSKLI